MGKILGIDQGITSVGWGILDSDTYEIIDAGVRLFPEADKANNEGRRGFRSSRRLKRRRANRREDLISILKNNDLYSDEYKNLDPYKCRLKGLTEKLDKQELSCALLNICKHRGSSLDVVEDENVKQDENSTKYQIQSNDALLKSGKYVCEVQIERREESGKIRGINNNFRTSDYVKELEKILSTQGISDTLKIDIINVIIRKRHFDEGPGSFKSQTPYGRIYNDDGTVKLGMIAKMRGTCSVFPEEFRAPKLAPSAEKFNLLNDLNNLTVTGEKIPVELKQELVELAFSKGSLTPKQVADYLNLSLTDLNGFRINKSEQPILTELTGFKIFKKLFTDYGKEEKLLDFELMDSISEILTETKVLQERQERISELLDDYELVEALCKQIKFTEYHSLSLKAIRLLNKEMYISELNQMQILHDSNIFDIKHNIESQKGKKQIALRKDAILSPVALRSYRQAVKVINAARERFGEFDAIVIETTRAKNSKEQKKWISEQQQNNELRNKRFDEIVQGYPHIKENKNIAKIREKIRLYEEQEGKTSYLQEPIDLDLLINDDTAYEVDHIIPLSVSLDDSLNNKTLCSRRENQQKGNLTPYLAFEKGELKGNFEQYKGYITSLYSRKRISKKKFENYMYMKDITRYTNMKDFIARNLVDTSYANRLLLNTLQDYFNANNIGTKVNTVKGLATSNFRKYLRLKKDREIDYSHHAIDALLVASVYKMSIYRELLNKSFVKDGEVDFNTDKGSIESIIDENLFSQKEIQFVKQIENFTVENIPGW